MKNTFIESKDFMHTDDIIYFQANRLDKERSFNEVENILKLLNFSDDRLEVLDVPCGFGRHCEVFAKLGHSVTGVDLSNSLIEYAKNSSRASDLMINYQKQDMIVFESDLEYDLIINLFNSFGYYGKEGDQSLLNKFYGMLKKDGKLVIDTINAQNVISNGFLDNVVLRRKENTLSISKKLLDNHKVSYRIEIERESNQYHTAFSVQYYTSDDMIQMIKEAGFKEVKLYADFEGSDFEIYAKKMLVIATK